MKPYYLLTGKVILKLNYLDYKFEIKYVKYQIKIHPQLIIITHNWYYLCNNTLINF